MLIERLIIDGNWIANGYFFKRLDRGLERKKFMPLFRSYADEAEEVTLISTTPENKGGWDCLKFTDGEKVYFAQLKYVKEIGFDPENDLRFKLSPEQDMIFAYNLGVLVGGVMLVQVPEETVDDEIDDN